MKTAILRFVACIALVVAGVLAHQIFLRRPFVVLEGGHPLFEVGRTTEALLKYRRESGSLPNSGDELLGYGAPENAVKAVVVARPDQIHGAVNSNTICIVSVRPVLERNGTYRRCVAVGSGDVFFVADHDACLGHTYAKPYTPLLEIRMDVTGRIDARAPRLRGAE